MKILFLFCVALIFLNANSVSASTVVGSISVGNGPIEIVITPDSKKLYVANSTDDSVSVINTETNSVVETIPLTPGGNAHYLAVSPDGSEVYVAERLSGKVKVISTVTDSVIATIDTFSNLLNEISVTPDGTKIYVASANVTGTIRMTIIDVATRLAVGFVDTSDAQDKIIFHPNGQMGYMQQTVNNSNPLVQYTRIIDLDTNTTVGTISDTLLSSISSDGSIAWGKNYKNNSLSRIDINTNQITDSTTVSSTPLRMIVDDFNNPKRVFSSNSSSNVVTVLNSQDLSIIETIEMNGLYPYGMAFKIDSNLLYVVNIVTNTVDVVQLDEVDPDVDEEDISVAEDFESYPVSSLLNGGNGGVGWGGPWSSSPLFRVTDQNLPSQGLKHLSIQPVSDPFEFAVRAIPETASATVYMDMKIDHPGGENNIGVRGDVNLYENDKLLVRVFMRLSSSGDYIESLHWDGDSNEWYIASVVENQMYYRVGIQFDKQGQGNKYRINVDGGPWTDWREMIDDADFSSINKLSLSVSNQDGQAIGSMYFDNLVIDSENELPLSVDELLMELIGRVKEIGFSKPIEQSYLAHLEKLIGMLDTSDTQAIVNQLEAFKKKLDSDLKKGSISLSIANELKDKAEVIIKKLTEFKFEVPRITQIASPYPSLALTSSWADASYAGGKASSTGNCGATIRQCGCAISSLSMLGKYYGIDTGVDGSEVNPLNMDNWLLANGGYTDNGSILWNYALAYMGKVSDKKVMTPLQLSGHNETDRAVILPTLKKSEPALGFNEAKGHWMVLRGTTAQGYYVNDPFWYNTNTTDDERNASENIQDYNDDITKANLFKHSEALHAIDKSVEIVLESPAELLITDSKGRRLGYDSGTQSTVNEIPGGSYDQEDFIHYK